MKPLSRVFSHLMKQKWVFWAACIIALVTPLTISLCNISVGTIPFWYDPARDLLSAWDNLHKITLIGPTSGIPGIFYGPYWIWFLSIGLFFSKNPRVLTFIVATLPYYILFPFLLFQFSKLFGRRVIIALWLLFIFSTGMSYSIMLWNPRVAPVLFLLDIYLLTFIAKDFKHNLLRLFFAGVVTSLIINFHISFGLGALLGIVIFIFITHIIEKQKVIIKQILPLFLSYGIFFLGMITIFIPTLLFEIRHGFHQTTTLMNTFVKYGGVVMLKGLTKSEIIQMFFNNTATLLHTPQILTPILLIGMLVLLFVFHKIHPFSALEKRLLLLITSISIGILFIYLTAKNPVWDYHFIATEILFLLLIGLAFSRFLITKNILLYWAIFIGTASLLSFQQGLSSNTYTVANNLNTKEHITDIVAQDAGNNPYTVFTYNPALYTYDFSYIFKWKYHKDIPYDPNLIQAKENICYLIIPSTSEVTKKDFIEYRTPAKEFQTEKLWNLEDGTTILKRVRITSSNI